jgi:hypothetical protein
VSNQYFNVQHSWTLSGKLSHLLSLCLINTVMWLKIDDEWKLIRTLSHLLTMRLLTLSFYVCALAEHPIQRHLHSINHVDWRNSRMKPINTGSCRRWTTRWLPSHFDRRNARLLRYFLYFALKTNRKNRINSRVIEVKCKFLWVLQLILMIRIFISFFGVSTLKSPFKSNSALSLAFLLQTISSL